MARQTAPVLLAMGASATLFGCAGPTLDDRECMTRAMYFESNRSSEDGMLAVGTTVMNRLESGKYPHSVCGVVGQRGQYAPGVLTQPMSPRLAARVAAVADRVLAGDRHPQVGGAMFFHTVGYSFPYTNMHYVAVAGGNAFYEKVPTTRPVRDETMVARFVPQDPPPSSSEPPPSVMASPPRPVMARARPAPHTIDDLLSGSAEPSEPARKIAAVDADWSSADTGRY